MAHKSSPRPRSSTPVHAPDFRRRLLRWFRRHGRDLPWRRTRDPYRVIVSEFMLQQTQVSRVESVLSTVPRALSLRSRPSRARHPPPFARAGRDSATIGGRPTCTGWRSRSSASGAASCPAIPPSWKRCPASDATLPARWRALPTSARRRRWTPTSHGYSGAPSIRDFPRQRGRAPSLGHRHAHHAARGRSGLGFQSGDHGAGRAGVHRAGGAMRRVSRADRVCHRTAADGWLAAVRHHDAGEEGHQRQRAGGGAHQLLP